MDLTRKDEAEGGAALSLSFLLRSFSFNFLVFWSKKFVVITNEHTSAI